MWHLGTPVGELIVRTAIIFMATFIGLRLTGRRAIGQMTAVDLILVLLVANAVQNAMVGSDSSLGGGLISAATLFALTWALDFMAVRSSWLRTRLQGDPVLLVRDGQLLMRALVHSMATDDDIRQAMHEQGIDKIDEVQAAWLERDGSISIVREETQIRRSRHRARSLRH